MITLTRKDFETKTFENSKKERMINLVNSIDQHNKELMIHYYLDKISNILEMFIDNGLTNEEIVNLFNLFVKVDFAPSLSLRKDLTKEFLLIEYDLNKKYSIELDYFRTIRRLFY